MNEVQIMKNMLKAVLGHQTSRTTLGEGGDKVECRKFPMNSFTHQFSLEEVCLPCTDEPDEDFTKLIEKNSFDPGVFSAGPSRKVSEMSNAGLTHIQEEEISIDRPDSADFESYSGDSNI